MTGHIDLLRAAYLAVLDDRPNPKLLPRLRDGLLLALAGSVQPTTPAGSTVSPRWTCHGYTVTKGSEAWLCDCKAYWAGGDAAPGSADFFGRSGKVCKHVAAVALAESVAVRLAHAEAGPAGIYLDKPANVAGLVQRVVEAQVALAVGDEVELPNTPKLKLFRPKENGNDVIRLRKVKHHSSITVARWGSDITGPQNRGRWQLVSNFTTAYREWVEELAA